MMTQHSTLNQPGASHAPDDGAQELYMLVVGQHGRPDPALVRLLQQQMRVDLVDGDAVSTAVDFEGVFDAIIVDGAMEDTDGNVELCRELRRRGVTTPILSVTDGASVNDLVNAFDAGADDVMIKPVDSDLLVARLHAFGRRTAVRATPPKLRVADLVLDLQRHVVRRGSREIGLSSPEYVLLEYLMRHRGEVLSPERVASDLRRRLDELVRDTNRIIIDLQRKVDRGTQRPLIRTINGSTFLVSG
jgi:DNA-binding response OmpR family regulator